MRTLFHILFTIALGSAAVQFTYGQTRYAVIPLDLGKSIDINDAGHVLAYGTGNAIFIWKNGVKTIVSPPSGTPPTAYSMNEDDQVTGYLRVGSAFHPFLWTNGTMVDLGTINGNTSSFGLAINDSGKIVCLATTPPNSSSNYIWQNGTFSQLPVNNPSGPNPPGDINKNGHVAGTYIHSVAHPHAYLYTNNVFTDLGTLPTDSTSYAEAVNNFGTVVGECGGGFRRGFIWQSGTMTAFNTLNTFQSYVFGINDSGQAVGNIQQTAGGAYQGYLWKHGTLSNLNAMIDPDSGWTITIASKINNRGEIAATAVRNNQTYAVLLTTSRIEIQRPQAGERWISGEQDTIRLSGRQLGQFIAVDYSTDSGNTYTNITASLLADSLIWAIPTNLLTTRAKIRIRTITAPFDTATSDTFKIKGDVLTRLNAIGHYEPFTPNQHGWSFINGTLWPSTWWSQFQYSTATDPSTNAPYPVFFHPVLASSFVDWPLWVEVFSESQNYWSTTLGVYKGSAQGKWKSHAHPHNGSCFGFAGSSFLAFSFANQFFARHPGIPNIDSLFSLSLTNTIQKTINGYYAYQFGKQSLDNDVIGQPKDPRTTLQEIRNMFRNDVVDIRTITIYNGVGGTGGAHTMAPISVTVDGSGPSRYRVNLYDSNNPGMNTPYIMVDSLNNTWRDFTGLGATWTGNKKFYLEIPVSNYLTTPVIGRPPAGYSPKGTNNIEFYNSSKADVVYTASNGNRIGFVNGVVIDEIADGIAIFDKNGRPSDPAGYYIPDGNYSVELTRVKDSSGGAYVTVFKDDIVYGYKRVNNDSLLVDKLDCGDGFSVASTDSTVKNISLEIIARLDSSERMFTVRNTQLSQNDSVYVKEMSQSDLMLKNYGTGKTYDLALDTRSRINQRLFENFSIALQANSTHTIVPNWNNLAQPIPIYIDLGNNGTIDDTIFVNNTVDVDDRGSLEIPTEYNLTQNYPNPFNPSTRIEYSLPSSGHVTVRVYNVLGQQIASLVNEEQSRGVHSIVWNGTSDVGVQAGSGVYFYRVEIHASDGATSFAGVRKMVLLK